MQFRLRARIDSGAFRLSGSDFRVNHAVDWLCQCNFQATQAWAARVERAPSSSSALPGGRSSDNDVEA